MIFKGDFLIILRFFFKELIYFCKLDTFTVKKKSSNAEKHNKKSLKITFESYNPRSITLTFWWNTFLEILHLHGPYSHNVYIFISISMLNLLDMP